MPPFGLLLIAGSHTHQENYARAFAADPRCRLIGLTDEPGVSARRDELNRRLAGELQIPFLDDLDAALARDDVHLVSVCCEPERRGALAARCARAGKHVYIDKPLTTTAAAAEQVVVAVREAGVKSQMFSLVRTPIAAKAKCILESGRLGKLVGLHCELLFAKGISGTADLSEPRREKSAAERFTFIDSKRELFCVGLYPLVLFQWLTGRRFTDVAGTTSNYFFAEHQRNDVEDFACLMLGMEDGVETTITVGRTGWKSHPSHGVHRVHLVGTQDAVTLDAYEPRLEFFCDAPAWQQPCEGEERGQVHFSEGNESRDSETSGRKMDQSPAVPFRHPDDPMGFWSSTQKEGGIEPKIDWFPTNAAVQSDASYFLDCIEQDRESDVPSGVGAHTVEAILAGYVTAAEGRTIAIGH